MRTRATSTIVAAVILVALGIYLWHTFVPGPMAFAGGSTVALADYHAADPTGVPAELAGADPIKRGEYLARAADCLVCHTAPGGAPYAGGLAIPLPFGTIYTTNITADKETGIGNYSDADDRLNSRSITTRTNPPLSPAEREQRYQQVLRELRDPKFYQIRITGMRTPLRRCQPRWIASLLKVSSGASLRERGCANRPVANPRPPAQLHHTCEAEIEDRAAHRRGDNKSPRRARSPTASSDGRQLHPRKLSRSASAGA
jgi:hypothetical protein